MFYISERMKINQPLVYIREDGRTVAEYKDGRVEVVR
ncbi:hypothetical protein HNQ92_004005 [Rhabdobacter roseus]|uniref:Uncharacterized protein n=1 Tax=Rhabdobacter roseus TaxID=1655419 RepID=A0A840TSI3_9BACT|nr:hypothetical protein [Rhabdobacter roseus]